MPRSLVAATDWRPVPRKRTLVLGKPRDPKTAMRVSPEEVDEAVYAADLYQNEVIGLPPYHYGPVFWFNGPRPLELKTIAAGRVRRWMMTGSGRPCHRPRSQTTRGYPFCSSTVEVRSWMALISFASFRLIGSVSPSFSEADEAAETFRAW